MIVRNAESSIEAALASLAAFDEVIVFDNGSTDATEERATAFANVVWHSGAFTGFGPTKNHAIGLARHDWVFAIDADESVDAQLMAAIAAADRSDAATVFAVHRRNFFMGREVRHSGWGDDWLVRLFNHTRTGYDDALVHEKVRSIPGGRVVRLAGGLNHAAVTGIGDLLVKVNRYSEIRRQQPLRVKSPALILLRTFWAFFRTLFLRGGLLDGWRGLVIALSDANGVFFKFMKPYADERIRRERERR